MSEFVRSINNSGLQAAIARPQYLGLSAWLEHIPFAFWLVHELRPQVLVELGTHFGSSYFAFCQEIEASKIACASYAVDTWKGDDHAGFYEESVFVNVDRHNNQFYSSFSSLVRSTFDDASLHFAAGAIDLLHIDGLHTHEAARHDFDHWLPKLSDRAVVLMHDTNVRERDFGVHRVFEELKLSYPYFQFEHGHGLGVLAVGKQVHPSIASLCETTSSPDARRSIHQFFARLGRACADAFELNKRRESK